MKYLKQVIAGAAALTLTAAALAVWGEAWAAAGAGTAVAAMALACGTSPPLISHHTRRPGQSSQVFAYV